MPIFAKSPDMVSLLCENETAKKALIFNDTEDEIRRDLDDWKTDDEFGSQKMKRKMYFPNFVGR